MGKIPKWTQMKKTTMPYPWMHHLQHPQRSPLLRQKRRRRQRLSPKPARHRTQDRFPRPFESLRDFYARTSEDWQRLVLEAQNTSGGHSVKELRKAAFEQAEERWWDCRE